MNPLARFSSSHLLSSSSSPRDMGYSGPNGGVNPSFKWNLVVVWPVRRKLPGDSFREQGQEFMVFLRDEGLEVSFLDPFVVQGLVDLVERQGEDLQRTVAFPPVAD